MRQDVCYNYVHFIENLGDEGGWFLVQDRIGFKSPLKN